MTTDEDAATTDEGWDPFGPPPHEQDPWTRVQTRHGFAADELVSTLQKEIRRGNAENAALVAYEMATSSPELEDHLWQRLMIISVEDVGFGNEQAAVLVSSLHTMRSHLPPGRGERLLLAVHAVRVLARSPKDRSSDEMVGWIIREVEARGRRPEIPDHAHDVHTRRGQEMGRRVPHWLIEGTRLAPELEGRDRTYRERMLAWYDLEDD
jgi:replication-associated recombination protein RarA